jgi:hypothetical protein
MFIVMGLVKQGEPYLLGLASGPLAVVSSVAGIV